MVQVITNSISLAVLLCFYVIFAFSINPLMDDFLGMSIEVTDQNNEGVFSSLSRNFEQTIEEINSADEKSTSSSSSSNSEDEKSTSSSSSSSSNPSNNADDKSTTSKVPNAASESSNLASSNSTKADDFGKKNQTDTNK